MKTLKFKDTDRIYFFSWTVGEGTVRLGWHGTVEQWKAYKVLHPDDRRNLTREYRCTGKEQREYSLKITDQVKKLMG